MEEINIKELLEYFKERILLLITIVLTVLLIGCFYSVFLKTPLYKSETKIVLVNDDGTSSKDTTITSSDVQLSKSLVTTYSEIIKSRRILEKTIENLSLDYTYSNLKEMIDVTNETNTEIITVTVTNENKSLAADIANEIIKVFSKEIKDIYRLQNVSIVDNAKEAEQAYNVNMIKDMAIYTLIGLVLALGIIFVVFYFDTTIKSADEVESKYNIPVIGVVPRVKRKEK